MNPIIERAQAHHANLGGNARFKPEDPITAMTCGLLDGYELRLPFAVPHRFWQNSVAYAAGYRAGCTGDPIVLTKYGVVPSWNIEEGFPVEVTYIDGSSYRAKADQEIVDLLMRDPTVSSYKPI